MDKPINSKIDHMKRNMVLALIALIMMPLNSMAQDIFAKYKDNSDITYVHIKPKMFQILAKLDVNTDNADAQEYADMVKSITSLKAIVTEEGSVSKDISTWVDSKSRDLEEFMEVRDDGAVVKFFVRDGKDENGKGRKFETVIVALTGNIDLSQINFDLISEQAQLKESSASILTEESMIFKDLKIYPNPSNDVVTIDLPSALDNNVNITVTDTQGKKIKTKVLNAEKNTLDVSSLQTGVYLIQISHNDSRIVKRFVKQ